MNNTMTTETKQREIKFRGKEIGINKWVYGSYVTYLDTEYEGSPRAHAIINDRGVWSLVDKKTIGQYTGLKDKAVKEIYEGDIVRWDDMTNGERWRVAVVEIKPDLQFKIIRINCDFKQSAQEGYVFRFGNFIYKDTHNHLEVVGNIYQHPELLQTSN
jgi:uncharacterized phage protein (TIGR01671 family)